MIALDISTACGYNFRKEHYLVLLNPYRGIETFKASDFFINTLLLNPL